MSHDDAQAREDRDILLTAYALGELNPAERAAVEAALADSAELRAELDELQRTIGSLDAEFAAEPRPWHNMPRARAKRIISCTVRK